MINCFESDSVCFEPSEPKKMEKIECFIRNPLPLLANVKKKEIEKREQRNQRVGHDTIMRVGVAG